MSRKIHQPHDKFMKSLLEDKEMAVEFFKAFLPKSIKDRVDLEGLEHSSHSFISENLRETQADIVFTCPLKGRKNEEVYLCLIVGEHKNRPDRYVVIQLGGYMFDGYRQQLSDKTQPLKVILPFLYYHGSESWEPPYLHELFEYDVSVF